MIALHCSGFSEGVKQLMPDSTVSAAGLFLDNGSWYTKFACINCAPNYRLNIHVANAGERILFGMQCPGGYTFNLRKPNGTVALTGGCPSLPTQPGYIRWFRQAMIGPFPQSGGYTPLSYQVTSIADTGDYYFEIVNTYGNLTIDYWDFQVVSGQHSPPLPADTINGRVWSQSWQLWADLGNIVFQPFNGKFFVYSDDGIVTKLEFSNAHVGAVTIFCNPYGCYNTGNFLNDRRSVNTNTTTSFPGIARYKVFLNNPDLPVYPNGTYGQINGIPYMIPDPAYPPCSPEKQIVVEVSKAGTVETTIVFPYGAPATTVDFYSPVSAGTNSISWNGLDGQGNPVPSGTLVTVTLNYVNGLTNLPIWDQESNPDGYRISLVRPSGSSVMVPMTYWDDSQITTTGYSCPTAPQSVSLSGCTPGSVPGYPGCHPWGLNQPDCHDKMINTWWYSSASSAIFTAVFTTSPLAAIGHDSTRCGSGTVMLRATVNPGQTVNWYDSITGGSLLLAHSTVFITPVLNASTTYYAEALDTSGLCGSAARTPVTATILPLVLPAISGPSYICEGGGEQTYTTQPGMLNYDWNVTSGGLITSGQGTNTITVNWIGTGDETVRVSFTNANGCVPPSPAVIHVSVASWPGPAGPVTGPSPVCEGASQLIFSIPPVPGAASYVWTIPPGIIITAGAGTNSISVNVPPGATSGLISVYALNFCGSGLPSPPFNLQINRPAHAFAGTGDTLCQGSAFSLSLATALNYSGLQWFSASQGSFSDPHALHPVFTPAPGDTGLISLGLVAFALPPCSNDTSFIILRYAAKPSASAGDDISICAGSFCTPSNSSAISYSSLQWTSNGTGSFSDPHILHPQYAPSADDILKGSVVLRLQTMAMQPCENAADSMLLTIARAPEATAGIGGTVCGGMPFIVTGAQASNYSSILWTHNGQGTLSGETGLSPVYTPVPAESGEVTLSMQVSGIATCNDSAITRHLMVTVYTGINADAGPEQLIPDSSSTFLSSSVTGGSGDYKYAWEPASLLADPAASQPETKILTADTTFFLTVTDVSSICIGRDSVRVRVRKSPPPPPPPSEDCILVHNVITPNGDGLNDRLVIDCIEIWPDNTIQIFTRWGDLVRSFERYDNSKVSWDGTNSKGEPLPDGTYYYVLTVKNLGSRTGWVFIRDGSR